MWHSGGADIIAASQLQHSFIASEIIVNIYIYIL